MGKSGLQEAHSRGRGGGGGGLEKLRRSWGCHVSIARFGAPVPGQSRQARCPKCCKSPEVLSRLGDTEATYSSHVQSSCSSGIFQQILQTDAMLENKPIPRAMFNMMFARKTLLGTATSQEGGAGATLHQLSIATWHQLPSATWHQLPIALMLSSTWTAQGGECGKGHSWIWSCRRTYSDLAWPGG